MANVLRLCILFVAVEAALSSVLCVMHSLDPAKNYGMGVCPFWDLALFMYHGLCSHIAILGAVLGDLALSDEDLQAMPIRVVKSREPENIGYAKPRPRHPGDFSAMFALGAIPTTPPQEIISLPSVTKRRRIASCAVSQRL